MTAILSYAKIELPFRHRLLRRLAARLSGDYERLFRDQVQKREMNLLSHES